MSGEVPLEGMLDVLRQIEEKRISGRLRFTAKTDQGQSETGEVELVAGQLAMSQEPLPDGTDPVERLLVLRGGIFVVHQRLPPLAVAQGDEQNKKGSLAVHAPSDLMTYCESAGLTGTLRLINAGSLVDMIYEAGELLGIRVDGQENADLSHVFSWEDGRFEISVGRDVRSLVPGAPPEDPSEREPTTQFVRPGANDTGKHFLKVLEVALTDIVDRRERAVHKGKNKGTTTAPPKPSVRPRPASIAPPRERKPRRDATVRVVIMGHDDDAVAQVIDRKAGRPETKSSPARPIAVSGVPDEPKPRAAPARTETTTQERKMDDKKKASGSEKRKTEKAEPAPKVERADAAPKLAEPAVAPEVDAAPAHGPGAAAVDAPESLPITLAWVLAVFAIGVVILAALARFAG